MEKKGKKKLFLDFDGTLAEFKNVGPDEYSRKGYSLTLQPHRSVVDAVRTLYESGEFELYLLSAVLPYKHCSEDKNAWLNHYLPEIKQENRIYSAYGCNKYEAIKNLGLTVEAGDIFLDDYTVNLKQMDEDTNEVLTSVKLLNGINDTNKSWKGARISIYSDSESLSKQIRAISLVAQIDAVA